MAQKIFEFHDVFELDGLCSVLPLIPFRPVDNPDLSTFSTGYLVCSRISSLIVICWTLKPFTASTKVNPKIVFYDGDSKLARAIPHSWPLPTLAYTEALTDNLDPQETFLFRS